MVNQHQVDHHLILALLNNSFQNNIYCWEMNKAHLQDHQEVDHHQVDNHQVDNHLNNSSKNIIY